MGTHHTCPLTDPKPGHCAMVTGSHLSPEGGAQTWQGCGLVWECSLNSSQSCHQHFKRLMKSPASGEGGYYSIH